MTTKEFYKQSLKGRTPLFSIFRRIHFLISNPFYRKLQNLIEAQGSLTKNGNTSYNTEFTKLSQIQRSHTENLENQKSQIRALVGDYQARHMDFDAILHRLGFIEEQLRQFDSRIDQADLRITGVISSVGPTARLTLSRGTNKLELPEQALTITHGPYGNFVLRDPDVVGDCIRDGGFWDEHLHDLIIRHSDRSGLAVDAGAYVGFHSCFLAKYFGTVVSFEPQPKIFRMLAANLLLNGHDNVEIHNSALYDRECFMRVADQDKQEVPMVLKDGQVDYFQLQNAAGLTFETSERGPGTVPACSLDSMNLEKVKFIKIDTQGSDLKVLLGAKETIRRCRPVIVFEYEVKLSEVHDSPREEYENFFREVGYELHLLRSQEAKQFDFCATPL
jgi:FkbM family methyltransferase